MATQRKNRKTKAFSLKSQKILTDLDPKLQQAVLEVKEGVLGDPAVTSTNESGEIEVDIIAKLRDPDIAVDGLTIVKRIGQIVTGSIRVHDVEAIRQHDNVISLKRATRVVPEKAFSVSEINGSQSALKGSFPAMNPGIDGTGVIVGVVDYGCDIAHMNFRKNDTVGSTRILNLWDQNSSANSSSPAPYNYGREFSSTEINEALLDPRGPYQALAYDPGIGSHGTHVMDIAGGNGLSTSHPGVAPASDLIFVQIGGLDFDDTESFGSSRRLLEAVSYIFDKADALGRPCVVNISLGTHGGPHDGSTLVEQAFDQLLGEKNGRAIVVAAGNSYGARSHTFQNLNPGETTTRTWQIPEDDFRFPNEVEFWFNGDAEIVPTLITPSGQRLASVASGTTDLLKAGDRTVGILSNRTNDPNNQDNHIDFLLLGGLTGDWQIELVNQGTSNATIHGWIERDDDSRLFGPSQSRFHPANDDRTHTLGSISCGELTIAVGSYHARVPAHDISAFSAEGPTRDGKLKPEVSAPGHDIFAAKSGTQARTRMSGTSMAAPHVTGQIALMLQLMGQTGIQASVQTIRSILTSSARPALNPANAWNSRYGFGRIDVLESLLRSGVPAAYVAGAQTHDRQLVPAYSAYPNASQIDQIYHRTATAVGRVRSQSGEDDGHLLLRTRPQDGPIWPPNSPRPPFGVWCPQCGTLLNGRVPLPSKNGEQDAWSENARASTRLFAATAGATKVTSRRIIWKLLKKAMVRKDSRIGTPRKDDLLRSKIHFAQPGPFLASAVNGHSQRFEDDGIKCTIGDFLDNLTFRGAIGSIQNVYEGSGWEVTNG